MNATDLFLNLLATNDGINKTDGLLNQKPAEKLSGGALFRLTFSKAMQQHNLSPRAHTTGVTKAEYNPPIGNANFTQQQDAMPKRPATDPTAQAAKQAAYRDNRPAANAREAAQTTQQSPSSSQSDDTPKVVSENVQQDAQARETTQAQATCQDHTAAEAAAAEDLRKIVAELQQQAKDADEAGATDKQMQQLLLDLLALLLKATGNGDNFQELAKQLGVANLQALDGLQVTFLMDKDGELYKTLSELLNQVDDMSPEMRDQLKLLVQVSEDKAMRISISDLVGQAASQNGDAQKQTLSLTMGAQGDADNNAAITLKLTPEAVANAQIVDLPEGISDARAALLTSGNTDQAQSARTQVALLVPSELLTDEQLSALGAEAKQAIADAAAKNQQAAQTDTSATVSSSKPRILIPLATQNDSAKPAVLSANAQFLQSDQYLSKLDMEALAKELSEAKKPTVELAARLERLISGNKPGDTFSVMMQNGKNGGFDFLKDLFQHFSEQRKDSQSDTGRQQQWSNADSSKDQLRAELHTERMPLTDTPRDIAGERIPFLGRSTGSSVQNLFTQAMHQTAEPRATAQNAELYQNVMEQIASRVQYASLSNGGEVRIMLRPEHLGDLQLKIRADQDVVVAKFVASSQEVKAIIESSLNQLRDALAEAGIKAGKIVVTLGNEQQQQQPAADGGRRNPSDARWQPEMASPTDETPAVYDERLAVLADDVIYGTKPLAASAASSRFSYLA